MNTNNKSRSNRWKLIQARRRKTKKILKLFWKHNMKDSLIWIIQITILWKIPLKKIEWTSETVYTSTTAKITPQTLANTASYPGHLKLKFKEIQYNRILDKQIANNHHNNLTNNHPIKKNLFKDSVQQPPFNWFLLLHHYLIPDKYSTGSNSMGERGAPTRSLIWCNETFTMTANNNNALAIVLAVNELVEVMHDIKGDKRKITPPPWKRKQPNVETISFIKGGNYPEVTVTKYVHSFQERKIIRAGKQYTRVQ